MKHKSGIDQIVSDYQILAKLVCIHYSVGLFYFPIHMTTQDIANRYYELTVAGDYDTINSELYSNDIISIEPDGAFLPSTTGMDAKNAKSKQFHDSIEEMIGGYTNAPIVAGKFFACAMGMEAKFKDMGVMKIDEMAVFECRDGKIIKETFFF